MESSTARPHSRQASERLLADDLAPGIELVRRGERCLAAFERRDEVPLIKILEHSATTAGNGAHEIRNWAVAHGAAGGRGFVLLDYLPAPEVYVGCAFAVWRLDA